MDILSNGSPSMLDSAVRAAGLITQRFTITTNFSGTDGHPLELP